MANTVLIVDDEPRVVSAMARCLRLNGFEVTTARSAQEALAHCEEQFFDMIVLDFIMPGVDGVELLARIRKIRPLARAVIVSGQIDDTISEKDIAKRLKESVEADQFLAKPVSCQLLVETISNLLAPDPATDWQKLAEKMVKGKDASIKDAKAAAVDLKKHRKK